MRKSKMTGNSFKFYLLMLGLSFLPGVHAQSDEENVGRAAAAQVLGGALLVASPDSQHYVNLVGKAVAKQGGLNYRWHIGVIKSEGINAFAMPGGFILLSSGLLTILETEDELAFVLSHEVAHVAQKHHYQVVRRQRLADQAAKGLESITNDVETSNLAQASGQIYARGLDKFAEFEADRLGVELMTRAGYDPAAALDVLEKLQRLKGDDPRAELLFSTHPSPAERMDKLLQAGIDKLPRPASNSNPARVKRFREFRAAL
jgi:predicted Zn-dependent protease